jgi:hypothetical protein
MAREIGAKPGKGKGAVGWPVPPLVSAQAVMNATGKLAAAAD